MSTKIQDWAWRQPLKAGPKLALMALADESNDQGMVFLGRAKLAMKVAGIDETASPEEIDNAARVLRRHINVLIEENYMMTGRRQRKWSRGRAIDVIFLNVRGVDGVQIYDSEDDVPGQLPNPFLLNKPVDNSENVLPDNLSGKRVSPSQDLEDNLSGKSYSETNPMSYRTKMDVLPDKNGHEKPTALKGTRARINPLINPSISQSASEAEPSGDFHVIDGLTDEIHEPEIAQEPLPLSVPELPEQLPPRLAVPQFRRALQSDGVVTKDLSDCQLLAVMQVLLRRVHRTGRPVSNPIGLCRVGVRKELGGLAALVNESNQYIQQSATAPKPMQILQSRKWCDFHNREFTSETCPICSNPRISNLRGEKHDLQNH